MYFKYCITHLLIVDIQRKMRVESDVIGIKHAEACTQPVTGRGRVVVCIQAHNHLLVVGEDVMMSRCLSYSV